MYLNYELMREYEHKISQAVVWATEKQRKQWVHHPSNKSIKFHIIGDPHTNQLYPITSSEFVSGLSKTLRYNGRFNFTLMNHIQVCLELLDDVYYKGFFDYKNHESSKWLDKNITQHFDTIFRTKNYRNLTIALALHDIEELVIGDIISPVAKAYAIYDILEGEKWITRARLMNQFANTHLPPDVYKSFMDFVIEMMDKTDVGIAAREIISYIDLKAVTVEKRYFLKDPMSDAEWGCIDSALADHLDDFYPNKFTDSKLLPEAKFTYKFINTLAFVEEPDEYISTGE